MRLSVSKTIFSISRSYILPLPQGDGCTCLRTLQLPLTNVLGLRYDAWQYCVIVCEREMTVFQPGSPSVFLDL